MRPYFILALISAAALTACGGGGSSGGSTQGVTPPTTSGAYSLSPVSTQASPLSVPSGGETDVTISPAISSSDTQTMTTKSSDPTCIATGLTGTGSSFNIFVVAAASGAAHGCTATATLYVGGQTFTEYAKVQ